MRKGLSSDAPDDALYKRLRDEHEVASKLFEAYNRMAYTGTLGPLTVVVAVVSLGKKVGPDQPSILAILILAGATVAWSTITAATWAMDRDDVQRRITNLEARLQYKTRCQAPVGAVCSYSVAVMTMGCILVIVLAAIAEREAPEFGSYERLTASALFLMIPAAVFFYRRWPRAPSASFFSAFYSALRGPARVQPLVGDDEQAVVHAADVPEHIHRRVLEKCAQRGVLPRDYILELLAKDGIT